MRVVSLLPAATEIVAALGMADALVGVSHECDFPPGVERLPCARSGEVWLVDGSAYCSRPGPRIVDSLEILARLLHPERWPAGPLPAGVERALDGPEDDARSAQHDGERNP